MAVVIDDRLLLDVLAGRAPAFVAEQLRSGDVFTTSSWYYRLGRAVFSGSGTGALSGPVSTFDRDVRRHVLSTLQDLPDDVGLLHPRVVVPVMFALRVRRQLNVLSADALAVALLVGGGVVVTTDTPMLAAGVLTDTLVGTRGLPGDIESRDVTGAGWCLRCRLVSDRLRMSLFAQGPPRLSLGRARGGPPDDAGGHHAHRRERSGQGRGGVGGRCDALPGVRGRSGPLVFRWAADTARRGRRRRSSSPAGPVPFVRKTQVLLPDMALGRRVDTVRGDRPGVDGEC